MSGDITESVPKILKSLWDLENELRGAAQNGVILRCEEARSHLHHARHHLDQLLKVISSSDTARAEDPSTNLTETETPSTPTTNNHL